jgi:hypothetical protein
MEGEEREASVIDGSCVGDELHAVESKAATRACLPVCKLTLFACSRAFRHNLNNIDTTEAMSLC